MQVFEINVRFMRRIQVREYEPAEAEVTIKAQLADGEKVEGALDEAAKLASAQVHTALGLPADAKLPKRAKAGGETASSATAAPAAPKTEAPKTAAKPQAQVSDIPDDGAPAASTATAASNSDIPDSAPAPQQTQTSKAVEQITAAELSKWIGEQVRLGKVTSPQIMSLYPKFGVSRFADLKPEKCGEAKAEIEKLIQGGAPVL